MSKVFHIYPVVIIMYVCCLLTLIRYIANLFALLNDENKHYHTQWQWMMDELTSAKKNGEKVSECVMLHSNARQEGHKLSHTPGGLELPWGGV